ncbi:MAG: hypothetical protein RLZZ293_1494 [Pseudomonadota bacterium]|jgi:succinate-semialdehyde dehydrogenase/glutarate-semialdehyde dehydrogenase
MKKSILFKTQAFIDGQWLNTANTYSVINPADSSCIAEISKCGKDECYAAILAAKKGLATNKKLLAKQRAKLLNNLTLVMGEYKIDLASIITLEQGKPFHESLAEVEYAISFIEWFSEEAKRIYGDIIPANHVNSKIFVTKEPIGIVGAITPWNFPLAMFARKFGAAMAAGCSVVWKPSEETPLTATAFAVLTQLAKFPDGLLNIVSGDAVEIGQVLLASKEVKKITFTGSTKTGKYLMEQSANTLKKLSLELGGNAPFIVFSDANLDLAVTGAIAAKFRNNGQTCVCVNRFYIHEAVYDEFINKFKSKILALKIGNGCKNEVDLGPLINQDALNKVSNLVQDAVNNGAKVICGGNIHQSDGGTFYQATLLIDVNEDMRLAKEEVFGPVACCFKFNDDEEVIARANNTDYGLVGYFYTADIKKAFYVAEKLEVGMVGVNESIVSCENAPFGGVKESGLGREGSKYGVDDYLNLKYTLLGLSDI